MPAAYITKTAKDGAGGTFTAALQDQDGTGASLAGVHALRDSTGANVNPATSDLQTAANALLTSIHASQPASPAQDGTDATGITAPTGGVGIRGWLSGNYQRLTAIAASLAGTLTTVLAAGSAIIGKVGIDQTTPGATNGVYDTSYATHAPVMCQITVPNTGNAAALSINALLSAANTTNAATCPLSAVPSWATVAFIQVPSSGQQVNFTCSSANLPVAGSTGYGTWIYAGTTGAVQGQAAIAALELIAAAAQIINVQFGG